MCVPCVCSWRFEVTYLPNGHVMSVAMGPPSAAVDAIGVRWPHPLHHIPPEYQCTQCFCSSRSSVRLLPDCDWRLYGPYRSSCRASASLHRQWEVRIVYSILCLYV